MKHCPKCQKETERNTRGDCKPCSAARYAVWCVENPEKVKANSAAHYAANAEKVKARSAAWNAANAEKVKARSAVWRAANSEKLLTDQAAYRAANRAKSKARLSAWQKANPEACRIHCHNRNALKRANGGTLSKDLSAKLFKLQRGMCPCCQQPLGDDFHLDHILPISLGGSNNDSNIQLLRQQCNNQKHAKHPIDFMQSRGFLL